MKKSSKNIIKKKVDSNYGLISNETKENLLESLMLSLLTRKMSKNC